MTDASQQPATGNTDSDRGPWAPDASPGADGPFWPAPGYPGVPWPAPPREPRRPGRAALVAASCAGVVAALGAPLGLLWAALAPSVPVRMTGDGALLADAQPEEFIAADGWFSLLGLCFGALAAVGVWALARRWRGPLSLFALTAGSIGAGALAWWLGRRLGADEYERLLDSAAVGTTFGKPPDLRAADADLLLGFLPTLRGDVLVPAFAAAVVYTLLAGWSRYASLRPEPEPPFAWPVGPPLGPPVGPPVGLQAGPPAEEDHESYREPVAEDRWSGGDPSGRAASWDSTGRPAPPAAPAPPVPGEAAPPPG